MRFYLLELMLLAEAEVDGDGESNGKKLQEEDHGQDGHNYSPDNRARVDRNGSLEEIEP